MNQVNYSAAVGKIITVAVAERLAEITNWIVQATQSNVQSGPFAGMVLPTETSWGGGDIGAKILGFYEAELHAHIERAIERQPDVVVNVGCAEGYYAIGLARRLPNARVHAFDISPEAQTVCGAAAAQNGVAERVTVGGRCDPANLVELARTGKRVLILMDCEGGETQLLGQETVRQLANCDLLIECHDFIDRTITPTLAGLLSGAHEVEVIREGARDPAASPLLQRLGSFDRWLTVCEFRPEVMSWLACWARALQ
jgi:hypothetical protein